MPAHKNLTGVDLHEPKGIETADSGDIYIADGLGSGVWSPLDIPEGTFTMQHAFFTSNGTWNKPADLMFVRVFVQGGGQGGDAYPGGGIGNTGGTSSFGAHVTATGGNAVLQSTGDVNISGARKGIQMPYGLANGGDKLASYDPGSGTILWRLQNPGHAGNGAIKVILAASLASTVSVTIGTGGSAASGAVSEAGTAGIVVVESYIQV